MHAILPYTLDSACIYIRWSSRSRRRESGRIEECGVCPQQGAAGDSVRRESASALAIDWEMSGEKEQEEKVRGQE
jgi:hypothetical protein